jgi:hypothetical protein
MSAVDNNLVLHLKLDAVREPTEEGQLATVPDVSDNHHKVDVNGSPKLVVDKGFGSCLQFKDSRVDDYLKWTDVDDTLSRGLTLSVWIYHEPVNAIDASVFIRMGAQVWMDFQVDANGIVSLQDSAQHVVKASEYPIQPNQWTHVAVVIQSNGEAQLWLSGRPAGKGSMRPLAETKFKSICVGAYQGAGVVSFRGKIAHMRLHGALLSQEEIQRQHSMDRSSVLNIRESSPLEFELWDEQQKSAIYVVGGEISHKLTVAIWNRDAKQRIVQFKALEDKQCNQLELIKAFESSRRVETTATYEQLIGFTGLDEGIKQKIIKLKKEAGTATTYKQLVEFKGIDEDLKKKLIKLKSDLDTSAIYKKFIELKDIDEDLKQKVIKFKDENKTLTELKESLQADFFIRNHHLELRFPRGTLSVKSSKWFQNDLDRQLAKKASELAAEKHESPAEDSWYIYYQNHPTLNSESLYLLRTDDKVQALEFSDEKSAKPALEIILPHITTDQESAGQVLPIELRPGPLAKRQGPANLILGERIKTVEVLSQLGQKYIPLHFDVVGSNTVLNDGASETALLLRITNVDREVSIPIHGKGNRQTQFVLACEITDQGGHHEWALTDEKNKVTVQVQEVTKVGAVQPKPDPEEHWESDPIQGLTNGQMVEWVINAELLGTHALKPNESIYLRLKVKTGLRSGPSDVHLYYRHILGYWDGSRACTLQKSPLVFHRANESGFDYVGIGTNKPEACLDVRQKGLHDALRVEGGRGVKIKVNTKEQAGLTVTHYGEGSCARFYNGDVEIYGNKDSMPLLKVTQEGTGNAAAFDGKTTLPLLLVSQKGTGNAAAFDGKTTLPLLLVSQKGTGKTVLFEGGAGIGITGVTGNHNGLNINTVTSASAMHVKQEGAGNAAGFEGGGGVEISGVTGNKNALNIYNISTAYPALWVGNKGSGPTLYVKQEGAGNAAAFEGGGGVDISGVTGNKNALNIYNVSTPHSALYVKQEGAGNAAGFEGGGGVDISGVTGNENALCIYNISTAYPALWINNKGSGITLYAKSEGTGAAAQFVGNVGIGTSPTRGKLEVVGSVSTNINIGGFLNRNGADDLDNTNTQKNISIYADGNIVGGEINAVSDARIKNIQGRSDGEWDLTTLNRIEITDYTHKDDIAKGGGVHKKVIAQQVESVYPQAVNKITDVVPDIYKKAAVKDGWVDLETDLKVGERVRLIGEEDESIYDVLEVRTDAFRTAFKPTTDELFVYGREVDDFGLVDYEAIAMLNVSATQQIKKEKDMEVKALQNENAALKTRFDALEAMVKTLTDIEPKTLIEKNT